MELTITRFVFPSSVELSLWNAILVETQSCNYHLATPLPQRPSIRSAKPPEAAYPWLCRLLTITTDSRTQFIVLFVQLRRHYYADGCITSAQRELPVYVGIGQNEQFRNILEMR